MKSMKFLSALMACAVMGVSVPAVNFNAQEILTVQASEGYTEGTYGVLTYRNYGSYIEISGCDQSATEVEIPAEIDGVPVTVIGSGAFYFCLDLIRVAIPDSVTEIGAGSFCYCISLTSINMSDSITEIGNQAFGACDSLPSIALPDGLTKLGEQVFISCDSLASISIPDSVTDIGCFAFSETAWIKAQQKVNPMVIVNNILIDGTACEGDVIVPSGVTKINDHAFAACFGLTSIIISRSTTEIGTGAFRGCYDLTNVTILNPECIIEGDDYTIHNYAYNDDGGVCYSYKGIICGYEDSTAQTYAEDCGYTFKALADIGDVNSDGAVDALDASLVLTEYAAVSTGQESILDEIAKSNADIDSDGAINALDASYILSYYAYTATGGTGTIVEFLK